MYNGFKFINLKGARIIAASSIPLSMDALTLRKEHSEVLIAKWKRKRDRRMVDRGDISLSGDDFSWLRD